MEEDKISFRQRITAWSQLMRLPNLFTVPGDPILGFLATGGNLYNLVWIYPVCASICLYLFGLISNDISDLDEDTEERPERPLPSGSINLLHARTISKAMAITAIVFGFAAGYQTATMAAVILGFIYLYNFKLKQHKVWGPILLACCRSGSVLLGAVTAGNNDLFSVQLCFALGAIFVYIYRVSRVAQNETKELKERSGLYILLVAVMIWVIFLVQTFIDSGMTFSDDHIILGIIISLLFCKNVIKYFLLLSKPQKPKVVQQSIGTLLRNLILFQAACFALFDCVILALIFVAMSIPAQIISRKFYSS